MVVFRNLYLETYRGKPIRKLDRAVMSTDAISSYKHRATIASVLTIKSRNSRSRCAMSASQVGIVAPAAMSRTMSIVEDSRAVTTKRLCRPSVEPRVIQTDIDRKLFFDFATIRRLPTA